MLRDLSHKTFRRFLSGRQAREGASLVLGMLAAVLVASSAGFTPSGSLRTACTVSCGRVGGEGYAYVAVLPGSVVDPAERVEPEVLERRLTGKGEHHRPVSNSHFSLRRPETASPGSSGGARQRCALLCTYRL